MPRLHELLQHNELFVKQKKYEPFLTSGLPEKKLVVITCMDTRLTELLPKAMNLVNGDAKMIKTAGAIVREPFGQVMSSLFVALYELGAEEVCVVGHHGCGMGAIQPQSTLKKMEERGIHAETIATLERAGVGVKEWLRGFNSVEESVQQSVDLIRQHPLLPAGVYVHGLVIDPETGKLDVVTDGYE
ncbi:carbonic anhydrase [Mechercharimyces sp. CAU 1602]|uniref:beta-class carbonic anhydrase n=1 Tax=Mechercharimyces sp. CAU 1602 TaxID=2973933 RepID=UPI0021610E48|nr:carbonic anhydrase [Mechercharimyces sp. CAU 1602]MCS1350583.1 carbonic anhydrase [Mechercharimyces sp. CAU 1602]